MSDQHETNGKFIAGFFIGGLIGALILFFLGTKEGKKTSQMLEKKSQDLLDDLLDKKEQIVEKLEEKKDDLTESAVDKLDDALSQIEDLQEKSMKTTANLRKVFKNLPKKH